MTPSDRQRRALVTGASGYVGGRLVPELLDAGFAVRALARTTSRLRDAPWAADVEIVVGDVTDTERMGSALAGVDVAYYLVHSIGSGATFEDTDRRAAETFATAAAAAGVSRIVYLGGLTPEGEELSPTSAVATRSVASSSRPTCRPSFSRPPSSSAAGAPASRCCAT